MADAAPVFVAVRLLGAFQGPTDPATTIAQSSNSVNIEAAPQRIVLSHSSSTPSEEFEVHACAKSNTPECALLLKRAIDTLVLDALEGRNVCFLSCGWYPAPHRAEIAALLMGFGASLFEGLSSNCGDSEWDLALEAVEVHPSLGLRDLLGKSSGRRTPDPRISRNTTGGWFVEGLRPRKLMGSHDLQAALAEAQRNRRSADRAGNILVYLHLCRTHHATYCPAPGQSLRRCVVRCVRPVILLVDPFEPLSTASSGPTPFGYLSQALEHLHGSQPDLSTLLAKLLYDFVRGTARSFFLVHLSTDVAPSESSRRMLRCAHDYRTVAGSPLLMEDPTAAAMGALLQQWRSSTSSGLADSCPPPHVAALLEVLQGVFDAQAHALLTSRERKLHGESDERAGDSTALVDEERQALLTLQEKRNIAHDRAQDMLRVLPAPPAASSGTQDLIVLSPEPSRSSSPILDGFAGASSSISSEHTTVILFPSFLNPNLWPPAPPPSHFNVQPPAPPPPPPPPPIFRPALNRRRLQGLQNLFTTTTPTVATEGTQTDGVTDSLLATEKETGERFAPHLRGLANGGAVCIDFPDPETPFPSAPHPLPGRRVFFPPTSTPAFEDPGDDLTWGIPRTVELPASPEADRASSSTASPPPCSAPRPRRVDRSGRTVAFRTTSTVQTRSPILPSATTIYHESTSPTDPRGWSHSSRSSPRESPGVTKDRDRIIPKFGSQVHFQQLLLRPLQSPHDDWAGILEICAVIHKVQSAHELLNALKAPIKANGLSRVQLRALGLLQACADNCGYYLFEDALSRKWLQRLMKVAMNSQIEVRSLITRLLFAWHEQWAIFMPKGQLEDLVDAMKRLTAPR